MVNTVTPEDLLAAREEHFERWTANDSQKGAGMELGLGDKKRGEEERRYTIPEIVLWVDPDRPLSVRMELPGGAYSYLTPSGARSVLFTLRLACPDWLQK